MNDEQFAEVTQMVEDAMNEEAEHNRVDRHISAVGWFLIGLATGNSIMGFLWNLSVGAF